jgi:hypothetical protein
MDFLSNDDLAKVGEGFLQGASTFELRPQQHVPNSNVPKIHDHPLNLFVQYVSGFVSIPGSKLIAKEWYENIKHDLSREHRLGTYREEQISSAIELAGKQQRAALSDMAEGTVRVKHLSKELKTADDTTAKEIALQIVTAKTIVAKAADEAAKAAADIVILREHYSTTFPRHTKRGHTKTLPAEKTVYYHKQFDEQKIIFSEEIPEKPYLVYFVLRRKNNIGVQYNIILKYDATSITYISVVKLNTTNKYVIAVPKKKVEGQKSIYCTIAQKNDHL